MGILTNGEDADKMPTILYAFMPCEKPCSDGNLRTILRKFYISYVRLIVYMYIFQFKPRTLQ